MCKKIPVLLALLLLLGIQGRGQISEKANLFGGVTYQFVGLTALGSPIPNYAYYVYGLGAGMDFVLAHSNDVVSLGVNPNAHLCFQLSSYYGVNFLASVPTYLLARVGAGATPFNEQKFGIGAGIGGSGSYFTSVGGPRMFFMNPGAIVEMCVRTRSSNYLFRFNWSLMRPTHDVNLGGSTTNPYRIGLVGLSLFYSF